jgi:hypothetical protein
MILFGQEQGFIGFIHRFIQAFEGWSTIRRGQEV